MTELPTPGVATGLSLPGGVSVSHVRVYDSVGPDGLAGGTPHLHCACTEAYLVIAGEGRVQSLSGEGFAQTPLLAGTIAWFAPGTVHRLVNDDGRLELFVLMSNAGLPEAGDLVLAMTPDVLADHDRYTTVASLGEAGATTDGDPEPARRRRDAAVDGFGYWRDEVSRLGGVAGLAPLHEAATRIVEGPAATWRALLDADPTEDLRRSRALVELLAGGDHHDAATRLGASVLRSTSLLPPTRRMGCCGTLGTVLG